MSGPVDVMLQEKPAATHGHPIGIGDWRFAIEVLLPTPTSAVWGTSLWGSGLWASYQWVDLTPWGRGTEWTRGSSQPYGRPDVGDMRITLDSDGDRWNPWNPSPPVGSPAYFSVGTIVRAGVFSPTDSRAGGWLPQFCGIVDQWTPAYKAPNSAEKFVDLVVVETLRDLATIDDNAYPIMIGGGENPLQRWNRLLTRSRWKYGFMVEAGNLLSSPGSYPLVATNMAQNRLSDCYLVGDTCDVQFRTHRTGAAFATNIEYIGSRPGGTSDDTLLPLGVFSNWGIYPTIGFDWQTRTNVGLGLEFVAYDVDSFESTNGDDAVINDVRIGAPGTTQEKFEQLESISRFGRRTLARGDLLTTSPTILRQLAQFTSIRRALNTLRVNSITVSPLERGETAALTTLAADVQSQVVVYPPDMESAATPGRPYIVGFLASMTHRVLPMNDGAVQWTSTFGIDTRTVVNIPGAQLTATPA